MSISLGIGIKIGGNGGGESWESYWSSVAPETDVTLSVDMSDSFTGTTIDTDKWDVTDPADGVTISQNGTLIFTINRASAVASTNTNHVDSKKSFTKGYVEVTIGGTATSTDSTGVFGLYSNISPGYQAQIISTGGTGATLRITINNIAVYDNTPGILFKNRWRISFDSGTDEIKFFYLNAGVWTQAGTTQVFDLDNGNGLKGRFGANSITGGGTPAYTLDDYHMQNYATVSIIADSVIVANDPAHPNTQWYGRPVLKRISDKKWMMVYANSEAHHLLVYSQLHARFSDDYGETWTAEDKNLDGSAIIGFPLYPPTCVPGANNRGPGEGWLMQCPDSPNHLLIQMWDSEYSVSCNGTWQSKSTDGGRSWSTPVKIEWVNNTGTAHTDNRVFATDDDFIYDGVLYCGAREYEADNSQVSSRLWFCKSIDNGTTWELVSLVSAFADETNEMGIEYVSSDTIVACIRNFTGPEAYYTKSIDMGVTWAALTEVQSRYDVWSRQRVKTRSHVKGTNNWWDDPLVICHGFVHVDGETSQSHPRRIAVWISIDKGDIFTGPYYLKAEGYDGGYGDFLYNPVKGEYVTLQYYAPTSLLDGEIRQINWTFTL